MLNINKIIKNSRANGHGTRYTIWVQGCDRRCPGCFNPETHSHKSNTLVDVRELIQDVLNTRGIDGITLSGGEPLLQARELAVLAKAVQGAGLTVMMFTGYPTMPNSPDVKNLLRYTDMVIAGEYDGSKPGKTPLVGPHKTVFRPNKSRRIPNPSTDRTIPRVEVIQETKPDGEHEVTLSGFPTPAERREFNKMFGKPRRR